MAPTAFHADCSGGVVSAHTIPRGANLSRISLKNHVLGFDASPATLEKTGGKITLKSYGLRQASTFYGFCAFHDRELFSCVENEEFEARQDQCFMLAFRSLTRELYTRDAASIVPKLVADADKGLPPFEQMLMQKLRQVNTEVIDSSIKDLTATFQSLCDALVNRNYDFVSSLVVEFDEILPFMFSCGYSPHFDLQGNLIQDLDDLSILAQQVFLSTYCAESKSYICLSWITDWTDGAKLANQVEGIPKEEIASFFLQLSCRFTENIYFSPKWHDALGGHEKERILELMHTGVGFPNNEDGKFHYDATLDFQMPRAVRTKKI